MGMKPEKDRLFREIVGSIHCQGVETFSCPHCHVTSQHERYRSLPDLCGRSSDNQSMPISTTICVACHGICLYYREQRVYPDRGTAPEPSPDMPPDVKADYEEARTIVSTSPRGAAALLRLVIQKLMIHLGEKGENINTDIGNLVKKGLPVEVQQALDVVRVVGNEFVHGGEMNPSDTPEVANKLFELVNFVVEDRIAQPKKRQSLFASLPANKLKAIADRDKGTSPPP